MKTGFSSVALVAALLLGTHAAQAQHVVTEEEAGKLTLEALTAAPPPPRPIYRSYVHQAMSVRYVHGRAVRVRSHVVAAAWHPASRHAAAAVHHRRR